MTYPQAGFISKDFSVIQLLLVGARTTLDDPAGD
jgi:hypothetical protein